MIINKITKRKYPDQIIVRCLLDTDEILGRFKRFRGKLKDGKGLWVDVYV
jgi:hypothetical protein